MSIERLRALVQSWREIADKHDARAERLNESGDASDAAWCEAAAEHRSYCADELATLIAELGQEVGAVSAPEGWALVPKQMALTPEALGLIETMCAGPDNEGIGGEGGEDRWVDGLLWVGETIGDDGEKYWGLNIACAECLDEGSLPIFEFDRPTSPAHTSEARDADAARYAFLRDSVACSLSISHNDHHNMYMSVADTFDSTDGYYNDIGNDERAKMIETDTIWTLHVYPNTPVGFNVYHGSSLDAVCDAAMRQEGGPDA